MDLYEELDDIEYFFFDLDKTIWNWDSTIEGAEELIETLKNAGKEVYFFTDNTLLTSKQYAKKLSSMGIETSEDDILTVGQVTGRQLERDDVAEAYVIGESDLIRELESYDIETTDESKNIVLGFDRQFNYEKARKAFDILRKGGNLYICSNEKTFRTSEDIQPHQGFFNSVLRTESSVSTGKSSEAFRKEFENHFDYLKTRSIIIGDRMDDIKLGKNLGMKTAAVMSGDLDREKLRTAEEEDKPDFGISTLHSLRRRII